MSKIILAILVSLAFVSCRKSNEDAINHNQQIAPAKAKNIINHSPLFLGLSPNMTEYEFSKEIDKLDSQSKLSGDRFIIPVNKEDFYFEVKKTENTIRLSYSDQTTKAIENVSYKISDDYLKHYENSVNDFLKIFDSKYDGKNMIMPTNVYLLNYGLKNVNYRIFQDSSKTVLIGYKINGLRYPSPSEQEYENSKKSKKIPDSSLENIGDFINTGKEHSNFVSFGLEVDVDYYYNEEFNKLFQRIKSDSNLEKKNEIIKKQKETESKNVTKNNIKEL